MVLPTQVVPERWDPVTRICCGSRIGFSIFLSASYFIGTLASILCAHSKHRCLVGGWMRGSMMMKLAARDPLRMISAIKPVRSVRAVAIRLAVSQDRSSCDASIRGSISSPNSSQQSRIGSTAFRAWRLLTLPAPIRFTIYTKIRACASTAAMLTPILSTVITPNWTPKAIARKPWRPRLKFHDR